MLRCATGKAVYRDESGVCDLCTLYIQPGLLDREQTVFKASGLATL